MSRRAQIATVIVLVIALAALFLSLGGCAHACGAHKNDNAIDEFPNVVTLHGKSRDFKVWVRGKESDPPVLVLHEITGLTDATFRLALRISEQGFRVYVPLLFGKERQDKFVSGLLGQCVFSRQFRCFNRTSSGPIVGELVPVVRQIDSQNGNRGVAVVGMCLTGSVPLELISLGAPVRAAMLSQPTLPFGSPKSIAAPDNAIEMAKDRNIHFVAARFTEDKKSRKERMERLKTELAGFISPHDIDSGKYPKGAHAVLTACYRDVEGDDTKKAFDDMIATFHKAFEPRKEPAPPAVPPRT